MNRALRGFTLVELIITISLAAIVLALGVPAMRNLIQNNSQATQINEILVSLSLARAEAVRHGANTVMCISNGADPADCDSASTRWEDGWIVFVDGNDDGALSNPYDANGNGHRDSGEDWLLQAHGPLTSGTTLRGNNNVAQDVTYNPRGFSGSIGTLRLCDDRGSQEARGIVISNTGRARLAIDSNEDGVVENGTGDNLTCP